MKKKMEKTLKDIGYHNAVVRYNRLSTHSIGYEVSLDGLSSCDWDGHYFISDPQHTKEKMIHDFYAFIDKVKD